MTELRVIEPEPNATIGERLAELQQAHEQGRLSALAFAILYRDGSTGDGWSDTPSRTKMIGAVAVLQARLVADHLKDNDDD